jgi:hypothetical protein
LALADVSAIISLAVVLCGLGWLAVAEPAQAHRHDAPEASIGD